MSSKSEKDLYEEVLDYGILKEEPLNLKGAILSYNSLRKTERFIYYGHEKIRFHERHPTYQAILKNEFTKLIRKKSKRKFATHLTF